MIKIIIADDHQVVLDGLTRIFTESDEEIEVVGLAKTGDQALQLLEERGADVVVLDIGMPGMEGASTLRQISNDFAEVKVLMLTMYKDADRIKMMVQNGAKGYLLKNRSGREVVKAVKALANGEHYFPRDIKDIVFEANIPEEFIADELKRKKLTPKEEEILRLLAQGHQVKDIAEMLKKSYNTIDSHKSNIMRKIGVNNVQALVRFAWKNGYCEDD